MFALQASAPANETLLLSAGVAAVLLIVVLIAKFKVNPFVVLFATSIGLGVVTGMRAEAIVKSFEAGLGGTLGHVAIIVALGTMMGKMMAESGGAERIAHTIIDLFGEKRLPWAMAAIGLLVGLPVFFEVGFVLLIPIAYTVARRTGTSLTLVALPMVAGLSVVHGLVPPHPAVMLAVTAYQADIGRTVVFALIVGIPAAILAGPVWARFINPRVKVDPDNPIAEQFLEKSESSMPGEERAEAGSLDAGTRKRLPSFAVTVGTILLPIAMMLLGSWANELAPAGSPINGLIRLLGSADVALLAGAVLSFITLGRMRRFSRETILKFSNECLAPTATITLLVGAGGGFGRILQDSGTSQAIVELALRTHLSLLLSAWLLAALVRLATGSATVAMTMAAGIIAPIALHTGARPELLTIATGAGSLIFSHFNDGGFWLVKEYFGISVADTLKSWSICETIISVVGLGLVMVLGMVV